jgi:hypothetical protein
MSCQRLPGYIARFSGEGVDRRILPDGRIDREINLDRVPSAPAGVSMRRQFARSDSLANNPARSICRASAQLLRGPSSLLHKGGMRCMTDGDRK